MGLQQHRKRDERGLAIVELALVLPVLACVLLGTFTGGSAYFQKISIVDAVREGARYGASLPNDYGLAAWEQNVKARVLQLSGGLVTAADICVALVTPTGSNTVCGVSDPPGASADPTVLAPASLVKVSVSRAVKIEFFFFTMTPTLAAKAVARFERDIV